VECIDDFIDESPEGRSCTDSAAITELCYEQSFPPMLLDDGFPVRFKASIVNRIHKVRGNVGEDYSITFAYENKHEEYLYGTSFYIKRFAGQLLMSAQWAAETVSEAMQKESEPTCFPKLWHDATEYDAAVLAEEFIRLQKLSRWQKRATNSVL
jgi:hypothetical protein